MPTTAEPAARMSRRGMLRTGGLTVTLGALIAACSESAEGEPGRVGYAPPATPLPTVELNDAVYLRTATSIEQTLILVYGQLIDTGSLGPGARALLERLIDDHIAASRITADLTIEAGGEPYECPNAWYLDRVIEPIIPHIEGDEAQDIPPSDDPERDILTLVNGLESITGAMYQEMVEVLTAGDLRGDVMGIGAETARHAAAVAILVTGAPDGYFSPAIYGEEVVPGEDGAFPLYAVPTQFGSLAAIQVSVGAPSEAGTLFTANLETPAANSFIYDGMSCDA